MKAFPIAGTTFVMSNFRTGPTQPLPTYKCATGCAGAAINMLYEKPYEDGDDNVDFVKAYKRFQKQCPKAK